MESTNKKRTAVVAAATAAALLLSGTFAWNMATDQTKLNEFSESDKGNYGVELKENFDPNDPWANKDVYVTNTEDNPVIVRVRLEEFYDLTYRNGTEYNKPEGYANEDPDGSAIFTPDAGDTLNDDNTADSATKLNEKISLLFGAGVVTMAEYNAMDADAKAAVKWVVDTDGWCYYTQALLAGETTEYLLDKATFNKDVFDAAYDSPYNLDYRINVRLQAISADLEDFGSHLNDMQWTNVAYIDADGNEVTDNAGRVITEDERADNYEILADSTITDEAMALVTGIAYGFATPYTTEDFRNADGSVAVRVSTAQELIDAVNNDDVHSILLTDNIELPVNSEFLGLQIKTNKFIELGEYTLSYPERYTNSAFRMFLILANSKLVLKHGKINDLSQRVTFFMKDVNYDILSSITLVGVDVNSAYIGFVNNDPAEITVYNSTITSTKDVFYMNHDDAVVKIYNSTLTSTAGAGYYTSPKADNQSLYVENSTITSEASRGIAGATDQQEVLQNMNVEIRNSTITGKDTAVLLGESWNFTATDSQFNSDDKTFNAYHNTVGLEDENGDYLKGEVFLGDKVSLTNCTINSGGVGYVQRRDSELTMKDCTINATSKNGNKALGMFLCGGDVTLDNVNFNVSQGETGNPGLEGPFICKERDFFDFDYDYYKEYATLEDFYTGEAGICAANYEAIQIIPNSVESINLKIIGGSYTTNVAGAKSVYVNDHGRSWYNSTQPVSEYVYNNTITISGNPTFTPATTAFDQDYAHTTIAKN